MVDATLPSAIVTATYEEKFKEQLPRIVENTNKLITQLDALPQADKDAIDAETRKAASERQEKESFVAPETRASLPALARHMESLQGFFAAAKGEKSELTAREVTAATLRWEPFDQFSASIAVLDEAVKKQPGINPEIRKLTAAIREDSNALQQHLGGDDMPYLLTVDQLMGKAAPATPASATLAEVYNTQLAEPLALTKQAAGELAARIEQLPQIEKARLGGLAAEYAKQGAYKSDDPLGDIAQKLKGVENLDSGLKSVASGTGTLSPEETAAVSNAWETSNALRVPVRELNALLLAANTTQDGEPFGAANKDKPGKYDDLLALTAQATAQSWKTQGIISKLELQPKLAEAVAAPSTVVDNPVGEQVAPPPLARAQG